MPRLLSFLLETLLTKDGSFIVEDNGLQVLCCPQTHGVSLPGLWDAVHHAARELHALCQQHPQCACTLLWGPLPRDPVNLAAFL